MSGIWFYRPNALPVDHIIVSVLNETSTDPNQGKSPSSICFPDPLLDSVALKTGSLYLLLSVLSKIQRNQKSNWLPESVKFNKFFHNMQKLTCNQLFHKCECRGVPLLARSATANCALSFMTHHMTNFRIRTKTAYVLSVREVLNKVVYHNDILQEYCNLY